MPTDTSEKGLESLIVEAMTGYRGGGAGRLAEPAAPYDGTGWLLGHNDDYLRDYAVDIAHLRAFLVATQPRIAAALDLDHDSPTRRKFLARLKGEITRHDVIHVLRHGLKHGAHSLDLFYGTPSLGNPRAVERFAAHRFSMTRQLRYSRDATRLALDVCLLINGLPIATIELKNSLIKQTYQDAIEQYKRDRKTPALSLRWLMSNMHY